MSTENKFKSGDKVIHGEVDRGYIRIVNKVHKNGNFTLTASGPFGVGPHSASDQYRQDGRRAGSEPGNWRDFVTLLTPKLEEELREARSARKLQDKARRLLDQTRPWNFVKCCSEEQLNALITGLEAAGIVDPKIAEDAKRAEAAAAASKPAEGT